MEHMNMLVDRHAVIRIPTEITFIESKVFLLKSEMVEWRPF